MNDDRNDLNQEVILELANSPRNFRRFCSTVEPVRDHLESVLWARLVELMERKMTTRKI